MKEQKLAQELHKTVDVARFSGANRILVSLAWTNNSARVHNDHRTIVTSRASWRHRDDEL